MLRRAVPHVFPPCCLFFLPQFLRKCENFFSSRKHKYQFQFSLFTSTVVNSKSFPLLWVEETLNKYATLTELWISCIIAIIINGMRSFSCFWRKEKTQEKVCKLCERENTKAITSYLCRRLRNKIQSKTFSLLTLHCRDFCEISLNKSKLKIFRNINKIFRQRARTTVMACMHSSREFSFDVWHNTTQKIQS